MFTKKQSERILAISLLVAAFSMLTVFITVCIRRKSLAKALLDVAAMEGAAGTFILWRQNWETRRAARPKLSFDDTDAELFDEDEAEIVSDHVSEVLSKSTAADRNPAARPLFTIPVDDEATEADFITG